MVMVLSKILKVIKFLSHTMTIRSVINKKKENNFARLEKTFAGLKKKKLQDFKELLQDQKTFLQDLKKGF